MVFKHSTLNLAVENNLKLCRLIFERSQKKGRVISPVLFNLYMSYMPTMLLDEVTLVTYADDCTCTIFFTRSDVTEICSLRMSKFV